MEAKSEVKLSSLCSVLKRMISHCLLGVSCCARRLIIKGFVIGVGVFNKTKPTW